MPGPQILDDRELLADKRYAELAAFCKIFVRRFFAKLIPDLCREDGERPHEEAPEEHEGERAVWESAWRRRRTEVERRVEEEAGSMLFVELLFWKDKAAARDLQDRKSVV